MRGFDALFVKVWLQNNPLTHIVEPDGHFVIDTVEYRNDDCQKNLRNVSCEAEEILLAYQVVDPLLKERKVCDESTEKLVHLTFDDCIFAKTHRLPGIRE